MQTQKVDADLIRPNLLLGSYRFESGLLTELQQHGVTHVLQAGTGYGMQCTHIDHLVYLSIEAPDMDHIDLLTLARQAEALKFIDEGRNTGTVLVHCQMGMSRSATLVIAYLMWKEQLPFKCALAEVMSKRHIVSPNPGFCAQLQRFQDCGADILKYEPMPSEELTVAETVFRDEEWLKMLDEARTRCFATSSETCCEDLKCGELPKAAVGCRQMLQRHSDKRSKTGGLWRRIGGMFG